MKNETISGLTVEQVQEMARRELATPARVRYLLLLMMTLTAAGLVGSLWLTEPLPLPTRTHLAFGLLVTFNLAWSALFAWVLARRKVLYAMHRVIAGWMAVAFCGIFLVFGLSIGLVRMNPTALATIGATGIALLWIAVATLRRAQRRRQQLLARRHELASQLSH